MLEKLKKLNPDIPLYSIHDKEFSEYGKVIDFDAKEITDICNQTQMPENGSIYQAVDKRLEAASGADFLKKTLMGGLSAQIGICYGYNTKLGGLEYHNCSEINVAATPMVLILGKRNQMKGAEFSSDDAVAFYLDKGDTVEIFATSLHFCPCQISNSGFCSVVVLSEGTNTDLDFDNTDRLLFRKNKWIICHDENDALIQKGVYPGIHGVNYEIKY
jgi:hypothetical protein